MNLKCLLHLKCLIGQHAWTLCWKGRKCAKCGVSQIATNDEVEILTILLKMDNRLGWANATSKPSAVLGLIALLSHKSQWVRAPAAEALGRLGDHSVLPLLVERMNDINFAVRVAASDAVKNLGGNPRWRKIYNPYNLDDGRWVL